MWEVCFAEFEYGGKRSEPKKLGRNRKRQGIGFSWRAPIKEISSTNT